ncbi:MAG: dipeptide epimerase [Desulfarculaceae bacterium]|jgi:muconate cycloisomerase
MKLSRLDVFLIKWPFQLPVEHSLARNLTTENLVLRLWDDEGNQGYGEGVPRPYVTGETTDQALEALRRDWAPLILKRQLDAAGALNFFPEHADPELWNRSPAAACALETAVLDLAGRRLGKPMSWFLGESAGADLVYSAVLPMIGPKEMSALLSRVRQMKMTQVKVKVGRDGDVETVAQVRQVLGSQAALRVDANGAWTPEQAVAKIKQMTELGIQSVEQPVAKGDLSGLAFVKQRVSPLIIADESICTPGQAKHLIEKQAVGGFNLRLSKCGGPSRTLQILALAREAGLACQLGCQVGELGVLSAAGRHFASCHSDLIHLEGSLTRFYLSDDVIEQDLSFGPRGLAPELSQPGLSVNVIEEKLTPNLIFTLS